MRTEDQVTLAGWYAPPANGAVILVLHGAGGSREELRLMQICSYATATAYWPWTCGDMGGAAAGRNRLGWQGTRDVGAALAYLQARPEVKAIGGLGLSMGGEALLGAASGIRRSRPSPLTARRGVASGNCWRCLPSVPYTVISWPA